MMITINTKDIQRSTYEQKLIIAATGIQIAKVLDMLAKAKNGLEVIIRPYRKKRSLDANAYMWVLCQKIAEILLSSKDEIYEQMIRRYGQFEYGIFKPEKIESVKRLFRAYDDLGEKIIDGQKGIQLRCYIGSSKYNTKEMSVLIDGIVSECKELEIETMSPQELEALKERWTPTERSTDE